MIGYLRHVTPLALILPQNRNWQCKTISTHEYPQRKPTTIEYTMDISDRYSWVNMYGYWVEVKVRGIVKPVQGDIKGDVIRGDEI